MAEQTVLEAYTAMQNQLVAYQLLTLVFFALFAVTIVVFMPFIPWAISKIFTKKPIIAMMDKTRNIRFKGGFILRNGMYHHKDIPMYFVKKYPGVFYFAGVPFDVCHIDLAFVQHPLYNNFIAELRKLGYPTWKEIETALEFNTIAKDDAETIKDLGFTSYEAARRKLNPANITRHSEILAPYFSTCSLDELDGYGADVPPASIAGEIDDVVLSQKNEDKEKFKNYMMYITMIVVILVGGALAYKIVSG